MVVKSPLKYKKSYGDLTSCRSSGETPEERLELYPQKRRRRFSSVSLGVFTLDRLSLPEKRILYLKPRRLIPPVVITRSRTTHDDAT
jgi:hypothetical protein